MSNTKLAKLVRRREILMGLAAGTIVPLLSGCAENSALGRSQLMLISDNQLFELSDAAWEESLKEERVLRDPYYARRLQRVGNRVVASAGLDHLNWEFVVLDSPTINAWVLPNGKVAFYKGILDIMDTDDQLAAVMGHEVGHVAARHSAERASQRMAAQYGMSLVNSYLGTQTDLQYNDQIGAALGAGVTFGILMPYSRQHEFEADRLGIDYMVGGRYDPRHAIDFWMGMSQMHSSNELAFMSTHPSNDERIAAMRAHMTGAGYV